MKEIDPQVSIEKLQSIRAAAITRIDPPANIEKDQAANMGMISTEIRRGGQREINTIEV